MCIRDRYNLEFNTTLEKGTLTSTVFQASDGNTYTLWDNSAGKVRLVKSTYNSSTGAVTIDVPNLFFVLPSGSTDLGTIDYTTGKVVMNSFTPHAISDGTTNIKVTITPGTNNQDITPLREQIITIDTDDTASVNITMVSETII